MKRRGAAVLIALLALLLAWGVTTVYQLRVARGDLFPEYSTLRADPLGARALHDAVKLLPERRVERWTRPLFRLETKPQDLVWVIGIRRDLNGDSWAALDRMAAAGASVVVSWRAELSRPGDGSASWDIRETGWKQPEPKKSKEPGPADGKDEAVEKTKQEKVEPKKDDSSDAQGDGERSDLEAFATPPPRYAAEHERRWGFRLARRELVTHDGAPDARKTASAPESWPGEIARWRSDLFFLSRPGDGWNTLYQRGGDIVMMSRARGTGRITLLADSFPLSNEAAQRERPTALLADLVGTAPRIVFVESHLGVEAEVGVAALARRYGLGGAALMALVVAALWFWRRASPLAPVPEEEAELRLAIAPTAGLEALLRRAVPPEKLHQACLEAWRATAGAADRRRLEAITFPTETDPVAAHRAALRALSKKQLS